MADTIKLKIKEFEMPKVKCATCDNTMSEFRAFKFPICDDCLKALREIIKERKNEQRL